MNNGITVTVFVSTESLDSFYELARELHYAPIEDAPIFDAKGIDYTTESVGSYINVNIPIKLYFKFKACTKA